MADLKFSIWNQLPAPKVEQAWNEFLERADVPSCYTSPFYFKDPLLAGARRFAILAERGNDIVGVLTGIDKGTRVDSGLCQRPQISIDRSSDPATIASALAEGLQSVSQRAKLLTFYTWRRMAPESRPFRCSTYCNGVVMVDLTQGPERLFNGFSKTRRNAIRASMRSGVEVTLASTPEDFAGWYSVYKAWIATKGKTPVALSVMEQGFRHTDIRKVFVARHEGQIIAGSIFRLYQKGLVEYAANCSLPQFQHLKPNELLIGKAIEWASNEGFVSFSLGGNNLFKRKCGGRVDPVYRYRADRTLLRRYDIEEYVRKRVKKGLSYMSPRVSGLLNRVAKRTSTDD